MTTSIRPYECPACGRPARSARHWTDNSAGQGGSSLQISALRCELGHEWHVEVPEERPVTLVEADEVEEVEINKGIGEEEERVAELPEEEEDEDEDVLGVREDVATRRSRRPRPVSGVRQ